MVSALPGSPLSRKRMQHLAGDVFLAQLGIRHIDADRQFRAVPPPDAALPQRLSRSTQRPTSRIRPLCSSIGTNSAGGDIPAVGGMVAQQRFAAVQRVAAGADLRLVTDRKAGKPCPGHSFSGLPAPPALPDPFHSLPLRKTTGYSGRFCLGIVQRVFSVLVERLGVGNNVLTKGDTPA